MAEKQVVEVRQAPTEQRFETWKSVTRSKVRIKRIGEFGRIYSESILAGARFTITPEERRLNQVETSKKEYDVFSNGMLQPLSLFEDDPDFDVLMESPNHLPEEDPSKIFRLHGDKFRQRVQAITSVATVRRLLELADDERTKATVAQHRVIEEHLASIDVDIVHIKTQVEEKLQKGEPGPTGDEDTFKPIRLSS